MITTQSSPLDHLAAFAIVFIAGVLSTVTLAAYIGKVKRDAVEEAGLNSA